ncbi:MAG: hypothetical protein A3E78_07480 [Alphaproteobacteria bacterium RIFCSPHIGHO2_12_FULL_63_12]|nr:MAG: hypothetical protein A3E78_07480 [Alphaproteobacteria bacterium RIFCSPHIGHO2_12_FULL_63_12]
MSKRRWMPFYVADYLADTGHLSTVEHGAYMLLIMHYWQNGGLPIEDQKLARICRMTAAEWRDVRPTLVELFGVDWSHKRIDDELTHAEHVMNKRSEAGRASAAARRSTRSASDEQVLNTSSSQGSTERYVSVDVEKKDSESETDTKPRANESAARLEFTMNFWPPYPHKVGRPKALAAFIAARRRAALDTIIAGLDRYIREKPPDRPWLNPATFLNQDRFSDEPAPVSPAKANGNHAPGSPVRSSVEINATAMGRALARRHGLTERDADSDGRQGADDGTIDVDYHEVGRTRGSAEH